MLTQETPDFVSEPAENASVRAIVDEMRTLAGAFDATISSVRLQPSAIPGACSRVVEIWRRNPACTLELRPDCLMAYGKSVLEVGEKAGRWLLPASMAGLQSIRLRPDATIDDVARLAGELAALKPDVAYIRSFHDWLFSDGAEGFDVDLGVSFVEAADALSFRDGVVGSSAVRGIAAIAVDGVQMLCADLDEAALRPELGVPIDAFQQGQNAGAFHTDEATLDELRERAESRADWSVAEIEALYRIPALREGVPADAFAARVIERFAPPIPADLLLVLRRILESEEPYFAQAQERLETLGIGRRLALGLTFGADRHEEATQSEIPWLVDALGEHGSKELVEGLFERAASERPVRTSLAEMLTSGSVAPAEISELLPGAASGFMRAAGEARLPSESLAALVAQLPAHTLIEGLTIGGPEVRHRTREAVTRMLYEGDIKLRKQIIELRLKTDDPADFDALFDHLEAVRGQDWTPRHARRVAEHMIARGAGARVVDLARRARCSTDVRLVLIDVLVAEPELARALVRFRWTSSFDGGLIERRLRELRRHLKSEGRPDAE